MLNEVRTSIKARLYESKYTPFVTSYLLFFIYFNAKIFLIFFDTNLGSLQKSELLSYSMVNKTTPLWWALGYTLLFPFAQIGFYGVKVWFDKTMKKLRQKIEEQTLLSVEESRDIRNQYNQLIEKIDNITSKYQEEKRQVEYLENELIEKHKEPAKLRKEYTSNLEVYQRQLKNQDIEIEQKDIEIELLKNNEGNCDKIIKQEIKDSELESLNSDELSILNIFVNSDNKLIVQSLKEIALSDRGIAKVTTEIILKGLQDKGLVEQYYGEVILTDKGLEIANKLISK